MLNKSQVSVSEFYNAKINYSISDYNESNMNARPIKRQASKNLIIKQI